jgi:Flp pilus assembly protein TadD
MATWPHVQKSAQRRNAGIRNPRALLAWLVIALVGSFGAVLIVRWSLSRADAQFEHHLSTASLPELQKIAKTRDWDPQVYYWLGSRLTQNGRHKEALQALARAAALNPKSSLTRAMLGLALARTDNPGAAEIQMQQAIALNPKLEFPHFALGNLYGRYNKWPQSADELKLAVKLAPNDTEAQYLLALSYGNLYQEDLKMDILERLVKQFPDEPRYLKSLGYVYLFFGRFEDATNLYRHILSLDANDAEGHYLLGRALAEMANTPEEFTTAEHELTLALSTDPNNPNGLLAMGILRFRRNQPAQAAQALERAIKYGVKEQKAWMYLGQSYARLGREEDARRTLAVFQHRASTNRMITQLENRLLNTQDDSADRIKEKADVRMRLIKVYMQDNQYQPALNHLTLLQQQDAGNAEIPALMSICQAKVGLHNAKHDQNSPSM